MAAVAAPLGAHPAPSHRTSRTLACIFGVTGVALTILVAFLVAGVGLRVAVLAVAGTALQTGAGAVWWALLPDKRPRTAVEFAGMGLALGTLAAVAAGQLLRTTPLGTWAWAVPAGATILVAAVYAPMRRSAWAAMSDYRRLASTEPAWLIGAGILGSAGTVSFLTWNPLRWDAPTTFFPDLAFHEALSHSLADFGPDENILASGTALHYHWFTHAWAGAMANWTQAPPFAVLLLVVPAVSILGVVLTGWACAQRLSANPWVPRVAVVLLAGSGYLGLARGYGWQVMPSSPSQGFTTPWLLAYCVLLIAMLCRRVPLVPAGVLMTALSLGLVGGKVSHAVVAMLGTGALAAAAAVRLTQRSPAVWVATAATWTGAAAGYVLLLLGGSSWGLRPGFDFRLTTVLGLEGWPGGWAAAAIGFVALLLAVAAKWFGLVGIVTSADLRRQPLAMFTFGAAGGALLLAVASTQPGASQGFFLVSATAIVTLAAAVGLAALAPWPREAGEADWGRPPLLRQVLIVGVATSAAMVLVLSVTIVLAPGLKWVVPPAAWGTALALTALTARGRRPRLYVLGAAMTIVSVCSYLAAAAADAYRPFDFGPGYTWQRGQYDAGMWLRDAAEPDDVTVTNRLCSDPALTPPDCMNLWAQVAPLTGLRSWVEAYDASIGYRSLPTWVLERIEVTRRFTSTPNADDARLLWDSGVRWVWLDAEAPAATDWSGYGEQVYANEDVRIIRLRPPTN